MSSNFSSQPKGLVSLMIIIILQFLTILPPLWGLPVFNVAQEEGMRPGSHFYHLEDGWHYHINVERDGTLYFKCVRFERGCRGRAMYDDIDGFVVTRRHNGHTPDPHYPDEMALRRNCLRRCENLEYISFSNIIAQESYWFHPEVRARITTARMRTPMREARMRNYPNVPHNLQELSGILQDPQHRVITMTEDGVDNIYGGSVTDINGHHHILFVSDRMLDRLRSFNVLHGDGTFKIVPAGIGAEQVFAIVGVWRHHIVPLAWVLMESRTEIAYTAVFELLRQRTGPNIQLRRVISDFETGQQNAWLNVFRVRTQGCMWHLCRAFLQQVVAFGILIHMRRIYEVRRIIRLTLALPLLPEELILRGMIVIIQEARNEGNHIYRIVYPFLMYIWTYYVSRPWTRQRMSVFGSTQRTNNACESHNRAMRTTVGTHPNIYVFMNGLITIEQRTQALIDGLEEGRRVGRGRKQSSIMNDARIRQLTEDLMEPPGAIDQSIFRFLAAASHTMDNMIQELLEEHREREERERRRR